MKTSIFASWPTVRSLPGIAAVKVVLLLNVVDTFAPLNSTTVELTKLPPVTVRVALLSPAVALVGEILVAHAEFDVQRLAGEYRK